jgi:acyl dehydratase
LESRKEIKRYFEDFQVGETLELGSVTVTEESIIAFAREFDPQPFHTDPVLAARSAFGGLVASGWHTAGLFMRLLVDGLLIHTDSMGSPGVDELRWRVPVRPGDTLQGRLEVLACNESQSRPDRGIVRSRGEMINQRGEVVMHWIGVTMIGRRPKG